MSNSPPFSSIHEALVDALPYPLYLVDRNLSVRQTNPSAAELSVKLGIKSGLPASVQSQLEEAIARNQEMVGDDFHRAVHFSSEQSCIPQIYRLADAFDGQEGWAVLLVDVTRLGKKVSANAKMLSALTHEVRTPLASIRMSLHLLLEEKLGALNPDQRELLEVARDECERMLSIVQSQLEIARREFSTKPAIPPDRIG